MGAFSRSWTITKLSFGVINKDRELLLFPILGGLLSILYIIALISPLKFIGAENLERFNSDCFVKSRHSRVGGNPGFM